jgi:carbon monoxide dehydrogenase subunit G
MIHIEGRVDDAGLTRSVVEAALGEWESLAGTVPGLSELRWKDGGHFTGQLVVRLPVGLVRSRVQGQIGRDAGGDVVVHLVGDVTHVAGTFEATARLAAEVAGNGGTGLRYQLQVTLGGWLASLGEGMLRPIMQAKARDFEQNLRRHLRERTA